MLSKYNIANMHLLSIILMTALFLSDGITALAEGRRTVMYLTGYAKLANFRVRIRR